MNKDKKNLELENKVLQLEKAILLREKETEKLIELCSSQYSQYPSFKKILKLINKKGEIKWEM